MENLSRNIENQEVKSVDKSDFNGEKYEQNIMETQKERAENKKQNEPVIADLITKYNEDDNKTGEVEDVGKIEEVENVDKKEQVSEFIRDKCYEPIGSVEKVVPFKQLAKILLEDAQNEVNKADEEISKSYFVWKLKPWVRRRENQQVLNSIKKGNAKDKRIYNLPAYKSLIEKWFILPSDVRNYYDSANREPVYHLWVDYNVKAWTQVKSIYDGKVVASGLDWWLWHKVIIEHTTDKWDKFYSLYGHMWSANLPKVWSDVKTWDIIGKVWKPFTKENWKWEEHLHFQIMESVDSPKWYSKDEWEWNYDVLKAFGK